MNFTLWKYLLGMLVLFLLPFYPSLKLMHSGQDAIGRMVGETPDRRVPGNHFGVRPVIFFVTANNQKVFFAGPLEDDLERNDRIPVLYDPDNPKNAIVNTFFGRYHNMSAAMCFIVLIFWTAAYLAIGRKRKNAN